MRALIAAAVTALLALAAAPTAAGDAPRWNVVERDDWTFQITSPDFPGIVHEIDSLGGMPEVVSWEVDYRYDGIGLLHYYAGEAGTSTIVAQYRIAVVDLRTARVIGDVPHRYVAHGAHPDVDQPVLRWLPDRLEVVDDTVDEEATVALRPNPETPEHLFYRGE